MLGLIRERLTMTLTLILPEEATGYAALSNQEDGTKSATHALPHRETNRFAAQRFMKG